MCIKRDCRGVKPAYNQITQINISFCEKVHDGRSEVDDTKQDIQHHYYQL